MKDRAECNHLFSLTLQVTNAVLRMSSSLDAESLLSAVLLAFTPAPPSNFASPSSNRLPEPVCASDIASEQKVLDKLSRCHISELERVIRGMMEFALLQGKINLVVKALVHMLLRKLKNQTPAGLPRQQVALLLDWLQIFDPELYSIPQQLTKLILFGSMARNDSVVEVCGGAPASSDKSESLSTLKVGYSQAYLLAAFTHQATWENLENTIHGLLKTVDLDLDPSSVLDFVWAVFHVPKLWQGRERRSPRHVQTKIPITLNSKELTNILEYILAESKKNFANGKPTALIQKRIKLLFFCFSNYSDDMRTIVKRLNSVSVLPTENQQDDVCNLILYQMYLKRPCIIKYLSKQSVLSLVDVQEKVSNQDQSAADVSLHTLLTMLTSPLPGKDFIRRMQDLEATVRKMASHHPLLVIRHLPLLAATLQGFTQLHWSVFQGKNYQELFTMVLGILELLQPYIFLPKYHEAFSRTVDAYVELFEEHGRVRDLGALLLRTCHLLMGWVGITGTPASLYVSRHQNLFSSLLRTHPEMVPLRSLAAIAASKGSDHPKGDKISVDITTATTRCTDGPVLSPWHHQQVNEILVHLNKPGVEQGELLRRIQDLSESSFGRALLPFAHFIMEGILSSDAENRRKSWYLLTQLLKRKPKMAFQAHRAVLAALNCEEVLVATSAVKNLPKVILIMHEHAPDLLSAGFDVCLFSEPEVSNTLSEALFLLTINTGA